MKLTMWKERNVYSLCTEEIMTIILWMSVTNKQTNLPFHSYLTVRSWIYSKTYLFCCRTIRNYTIRNIFDSNFLWIFFSSGHILKQSWFYYLLFLASVKQSYLLCFGIHITICMLNSFTSQRDTHAVMLFMCGGWRGTGCQSCSINLNQHVVIDQLALLKAGAQVDQ